MPLRICAIAPAILQPRRAIVHSPRYRLLNKRIDNPRSLYLNLLLYPTSRIRDSEKKEKKKESRPIPSLCEFRYIIPNIFVHLYSRCRGQCKTIWTVLRTRMSIERCHAFTSIYRSASRYFCPPRYIATSVPSALSSILTQRAAIYDSRLAYSRNIRMDIKCLCICIYMYVFIYVQRLPTLPHSRPFIPLEVPLETFFNCDRSPRMVDRYKLM